MNEIRTIIGPPECGNLRAAKVNDEMWFANADVCRILNLRSARPHINLSETIHVCSMKFPATRGYQNLFFLDETAVRFLLGKLGSEKEKEKAVLELMMETAAKAFTESDASSNADKEQPSQTTVVPAPKTADAMERIIQECENLSQYDLNRIFVFVLGYKAGMISHIDLKKEATKK